MVEIEFTDPMFWRLINRVPLSDTAANRVDLLKQYLAQHWSASIIYDMGIDPADRFMRRQLQFKDPKQAMEFVLKYG
jgi:hypothetical protein